MTSASAGSYSAGVVVPPPRRYFMWMRYHVFPPSWL